MDEYEVSTRISTEYKKSAMFFCAIVVSLFFNSSSSGHDNDVVHPGLTDAAISLVDIPEITEHGFFDINTDAQCSRIDEGSVKEDLLLPARIGWDDSRWGSSHCGVQSISYLQHGYNPITGGGWANLGDIDALSYSVTRWEEALRDYRSGYKDDAYFGLGRVCHLVEDMTSPAHVHGDVHIFGDDFESWGPIHFGEYNFSTLGLSSYIPGGTIFLPDGTEVEGKSIQGIMHSMALFTYNLSRFHGGNFTWGQDPPDSELNRMSNDTLRWDWWTLGWYIENVGYYYPDPLGNSNWWECVGDSSYFYLENIDQFTPAVFEKPGVYEVSPNTRPLVQIYGDFLYPKCVEYCAGLLRVFIRTVVANIDVVEIIDRSGSMGGSKIAAARDAAKLFVDMMDTGDKIGVVSFSSGSSVNFALTEIQDGTKDQAKSAINSISAGGGTSIGAGLQAGWGQLQNYPDDPVRAMVLMSDGHHNRSPHPDSVLPSIAGDVLIYTIGFGSGADATMMTNIASQRNGKYYYAPSEKELREIYFAISGRIRGERLGMNETGTATTGQTGHSLTVDESVTTARIGIDWSGSDLDLALVNPTGQTINHTNVDQYPNISLEIGDTYEIYVIENPMPGHWEMLVDAVDVPPGGEEYRVYALFRTPITAELQTDKDIYLQGEPMQLTVTLSDPAPITGADVEVVVTAPSEPGPFTVSLYDDGAHNDGAANDGVYGGTFTVTRYAESYRVQAEVSGTSNQGYVFHRVDWKSVVVNPATDPDGDGMPSDWETAHGLDPITWDADGDPDGDGVPNITEYQNGLDPQDWDCDDDGWSDGEELGAGSDPLNPDSVPMDDVTSQADVSFSQLRWDRFTLHSTCQVTMTNLGSAKLGPILQFAIGNIIPANVTIANADGTTIYGEPYIDVGAVSGPSGLAPGESVTVTVAFHNADRERFAIEYSLLTERPLPGSRATTMKMMALGPEAARSTTKDNTEQIRLEAVIEGIDLGPSFEGAQPPKIEGDISGNRTVDSEDLVFLGDAWLQTGCSEWNAWCHGSDVNNDKQVNLLDMSVVANCWLETGQWGD